MRSLRILIKAGGQNNRYLDLIIEKYEDGEEEELFGKIK